MADLTVVIRWLYNAGMWTTESQQKTDRARALARAIRDTMEYGADDITGLPMSEPLEVMERREIDEAHAEAMLEHAARTGFTGTIHGETFTSGGESYRQVFEYRRGFCTDAYVTRAGIQL
jgi:hypothetical protein